MKTPGKYLIVLYLLGGSDIPLFAGPSNAVLSAKFSASALSGFIENKGQLCGFDEKRHPEVKFYYDAGGLQIFLTGSGIFYQFTRKHYPEGYAEAFKPHDDYPDYEKQQELSKKIRTETFRMDMELIGANPNPKIIYGGRSKDYINYYNCNVLRIHNYETITFQEVYPGIDWIIYLRNGKLKYDFRVRPGGDPSEIKLSFADQEKLDLNKNGSFSLKCLLGEVGEQRPISYQGEKKIDTWFVRNGNVISFQTGVYDTRKTIFLDPAIIWSTYYGGNGFEQFSYCNTDLNSNVFLSGETQSTIGIAASGHQTTFVGTSAAFLVKFDASGNRLWATYYGGSNFTSGRGCATDAQGNIYQCGVTNTSALIPFNGHQISPGSSGEAYLVKFDSFGNRLWATYYGGNSVDAAHSCAVDPFGNVYMTGATSSTNNIASGGFQNTFAGGIYDVFLVKFNSSGARLWGTYFGGLLHDDATFCTTDANGNVFICGGTTSTAGIASGGHQNIYSGTGNQFDAFLAKFNPSGSLLWSTYYGGSSSDGAGDCATDLSGNVYLCGTTSSTSNISSGGFQNFLAGPLDCFLVKFNSGGTRLWGTYFGDIGQEGGTTVVCDASGNPVFCGYTSSQSSISTGPPQTIYGGGVYDVFIAKFNGSGARLWASYYGAGNYEVAGDCDIDTQGNIYVCGITQSTTGLNLNGHQTTFGGGSYDEFLIKICDGPVPPNAISGNTILCSSTLASYSINVVPNAQSYSWIVPAGWTSTASVNSLTAGVLSSGILSVIATNSCGSSGAQTLNVTALVTPTISVNSGTICNGTAFTVTPSGANTFTYSTGTSVLTPTANASYSVSGTGTNGCVSLAPAAGAVTVYALPSIAAPGVSICLTSSGTLSASGASTYVWLPGSQNGNSIVITPTSNAVYSVTGTSSVGCVSGNTLNVTVLPIPSLSFSTFSITCASLGVATVFPSGGIGPFSYTWMPTAQTTSIANNLNPNTYTLSTYDVGTGCVSTATTVFTSLIPLTGNLFNTPSITCNGANTGTAIVTNLAGGSPNQNYLWSNGTGTHTTQFVNALAAGNWSVNVTDALTGCQINSLFVVTQPAAINLTLSTGAATICEGNTLALNGIASGGTGTFQFSWNDPFNGISPFGLSPAFATGTTPAGSFIYTLTAKDVFSCTGSNTVAANFIPNPVLGFIPSSGVVAICPLETGTLLVTGATNYTWSSGINGTVLIASPPNSIIYTVTAEAALCTSTAEAYLLVKPVPIPSVTSNSPVCEAGNLQLAAGSASVYLWSGPSGFTSNASSPVVLNIQPNQSGVYSLTVTGTNGCTASINTNVNVKPLPTVSIAPNTASICAGEQTIALNALGTATLFSWASATSITAGTGLSINASAANIGTQYFTLTGSLDGCVQTATAVVYAVQAPNLGIMLSSGSLCAQALNGSPNSLTLSASGAGSYTLQTPNHLSSTNPNSTLIPISTAPPFMPTGIATATLLGSNGICVVTKTLIFSVIPNPTLGINSFSPVICAGDSYTYTANGADSYTWSSSTPGTTLWTSGNIAVTNPNVHSVFSVIGSSLGCFSPYQTSTITVNQLPVITTSPKNSSVCAKSNIEIEANGAQTYQWISSCQLTNSNVLSGFSQTLSYIAPGASAMQLFTVVGTAANGCSATANATASTWDLPTASIAALPADRICINRTLTLQGSGGDPDSDRAYEWTSPVFANVFGTEIKVAVASLQWAGEYKLTATDKNGCQGTATKVIYVDDLPFGSLIGKKEACAPFCEVYKFSPVQKSSIQAFRWSIEKPGQPLTDTLEVDVDGHIRYCFRTEGEYKIYGYLKDQSTTCENIQEFNVNALQKPIADFYWTPEKPVEGIEEVVFLNASTTDKGTTEHGTWSKFSWHINSNEVHSTDENTSYYFSTNGDYPVALVTENNWGCKDTAVKYIRIESDFSLYVPDAFSPNNDGLNDVFLPVTRGVKKYRLEVFNRWGERIYLSLNAGEGWDGACNGEGAKIDSYVWKIVLSTKDGQQKEFSGNVLLSR